jgi:hypothetical protein
MFVSSIKKAPYHFKKKCFNSQRNNKSRSTHLLRQGDSAAHAHDRDAAGLLSFSKILKRVYA